VQRELGPVLVFYYYSGHGGILESEENQKHATFMLHKDGSYTDIQTDLEKMGRKKNVQVCSLLDCCRVFFKPPDYEA